MEPYARVTEVWAGGPTSLDNPDNQDPLEFSKQELIEFGGDDKGKVNFTLEYDVTEMKEAAAITMYLIFDKQIRAYRTNLKSIQGAGLMRFRMPFLPQYDNQKKVGNHKLTFLVKLRPQWTLWKYLIEKVTRPQAKVTTIVITPAVTKPSTCPGQPPEIISPAVTQTEVTTEYVDTWKEFAEIIEMKPIAETITERTIILRP